MSRRRRGRRGRRHQPLSEAAASRAGARGARAPGVRRADARQTLPAPVRASARQGDRRRARLRRRPELAAAQPLAGASATTSASYHALGGDDASDAADRRPRDPDAAAPARRRSRRSSHPPDVQAQGEILPSIAEEDEIEFSWARQTARRVGTVVHEALERFGRGGSTVCGRAAAHARAPRVATAGAGHRDAGGARGRRIRAEGIARHARRCAWPLVVRSRPHARRSRSWRSRACAAAHIINAVIDRTFVDADGTRWVVDFKTSPHEGGDRRELPR